MATRDQINARTAEQYRTDSATNIGALFEQYIDKAVEEEDIFAQLEGPEASNSAVWLKNDLSKGGADRVYFNSLASLGGPATVGDEILEGNEEQLRIGNVACTVDFIRHAVGLTKKDIEFLAAGKSIEAAAAPMLAKWLGRRKQRDIMMKLIRDGIGLNTIRPNNKANRNALAAADTMSTAVITQSAAVADTIGARPINIMRNGFAAVHEYLVISPSDALATMSNSQTWLQAQREGGLRGDQNVIFRGGFTRWNGVSVLDHKIVDADTAGPIGSPMLPKALLGDPITAGTGVIDITGGGVASPGTKNQFFECFSGAPYRFIESDATTSSDSGTYYVVIVNISGADKGKWGFYSYTGSDNNGNLIEITQRLGSTASGDRVTTLGGVTWNSAKNTDQHPTGSIVLQANSSGVPIGFSFLLGSGSILRAYGSIRHELVKNSSDYGHRMGWAYQSIYGQQTRRDSGITGVNQPRGYVLIEHAVSVTNAPML